MIIWIIIWSLQSNASGVADVNAAIAPNISGAPFPRATKVIPAEIISSILFDWIISIGLELKINLNYFNLTRQVIDILLSIDYC